MPGMTTSLANAVLTEYFVNSAKWLGLHETDPTAAGLAGGEIVGGSYEREQVLWTNPSNRTVVNNNSIIFDNLPASVINYFVLWTAHTGGGIDYVLWVPSMTFADGGRLVVPVQDISITLQ